VVAVVVSAGCTSHAGSSASHLTKATTASSTVTTTSLVEARSGAAVGMKVPWLGVLVGPDGRDVTITLADDCVAPLGARAVMTSKRVVVTVYAANPSPGSAPACPPGGGIGTQALTLPKPVDGRFVVDGADTPATSQYVPRSRSTVADSGSTVRVYFPDRTCSRVSRASVVETVQTVTVTAVEMAGSGTAQHTALCIRR
jgi:hypothetical protein